MSRASSNRASRFDVSRYACVLRISAAWRFDIGTFLMRMFMYMFTIGTVSMLTLAGYSAFIAGTVAATISLSTFFIGPRVSRRIDERGQRAVVPVAGLIAFMGLAGLVSSVLFAWPLVCCYAFGCLMGFNPNGPALARARWAYLIRTGRTGAQDTQGVDVRTAYAYEGILEDIGFTVSPAVNIALAAALHPVAGMVFGGICLLVGIAILMTARDTEPEVGWVPDASSADASDAARFTAPDSPWVTQSDKTVFTLSSTVKVLFGSMVLVGLVFGSFDSTVVVFCQDLGEATYASMVMAVSGVISAVSGFVFGAITFKTPPAKMLAIAGSLFGLLYALTFFSFNLPSLFIFTCLASPLFAPYLITANSCVEAAVPGSRVTEGITWMNTGNTIGFAIGPTVAGMLMDVFGSRWGFSLVLVAGLLFMPLLFGSQKHVREELPERF